jgi:hypothetical protein
MNSSSASKPKKLATKKPEKEHIGEKGGNSPKETKSKKKRRPYQPLGKPLLTTQQVARHLGKKKKTLENWRGRDKGKGPEFIKLENGSVRYEHETIIKYIEANRSGGDKIT